MSTRASIFLGGELDGEHWYKELSEYISPDGKNPIVLEFNKKNIRIDVNDEDDLIISVINPFCDLYDYLRNHIPTDIDY